MNGKHNKAGPATTEEIRNAYDEVAPKVDSREYIYEVLGIRARRRKLLCNAFGKVLEIGVGTGPNFPYYPKSCRITAIDLSPEMLKIAENKVSGKDLEVDFLVMDAEQLDFADCSFDTVVSTQSLCTIPDPAAALKEIARVCKDDGVILLFEHGYSSRQMLCRFQDRFADFWARKNIGCRLNRDILDLARQAGLNVLSVEAFLFGIYLTITAKPA